MENFDFTIKQFLSFISEGKLKGVKCDKCSKIILPPRFKCNICNHKEFEWVDLSGKGKLLTYTIIYVPSKRFKDEAPYMVGIVELDEGVRVEARVNNVDLQNHEATVKTNNPVVFEPNSNGILTFKLLK